MEKEQQKEKALEQVVRNLLKNVKEQEKKLGYIYWRHNETRKTDNK